MTERRHAFLLAVHRLPEMAELLVRRLKHPRVDIFLHVDAKADASLFRIPGTIPVRKRRDIVWNGFGLVESTLDWIHDAHRSGRYATYTHLSGQDYLLRPVEEVVRYFEEENDLLVDMAWSDTDRTSRWGCFHVTDPDPMVRIWHRLQRKLLPWNKGIRKLPAGLEVRCGSALWTLSGPAVDWMVDYLRRRRDVVRFFRNTLHSDEIFYQMVMNASPFADRLGFHKHFFDWSPGAAHPETLTLRHLDAIRASGMLFGRKFDPVESRELIGELSGG